MGVTVGAAVVAAALTFGGGGEVISFGANAAALSLLAMVIGNATEEISTHLGPGATGVLQAALGGLPELFVCIFSLRAGLVQVVQAALIGSILANSLLVLGLAILVGGVKHGRQRFDAEPPRMIASLMMLAVSALVFPTLAAELHTPAAAHESALSAASAIFLLIVFVASIPFSLRSDPEHSVRHRDVRDTAAGIGRGAAVAPSPAEAAPPGWPLWLSVVVLAVAALGAGFVSEWFV
jgi:Ca2+:H+ antiporter